MIGIKTINKSLISSTINLAAKTIAVFLCILMPRFVVAEIAQRNPGANETRSTVSTQAILTEQQKTCQKITMARGDVVANLEDLTTTSSGFLRRYLISFAYDSTRNVTVTVPWYPELPCPERWHTPSNWANVYAGITTDNIISYRLPGKYQASLALVESHFSKQSFANVLPFVHFEPMDLQDIHKGLAQRIEESSSTQPLITEKVLNDGSKRLCVYLMDSAEQCGFKYTINPQKGYLNEEVIAFQGEQILQISTFVIGESSGCFIPARVEHIKFKRNNEPAVKESWYYRFLSVNTAIPDLELTGISTGLVDVDKALENTSSSQTQNVTKFAEKNVDKGNSSAIKTDADF